MKPIGLKSTAANPCVFTGTGVIMIIYVDDVLIVSSKPETGKLIWDKLNEKVSTKMTGCLKPNQGGSVKFVGRIIRRVAGAKELFMGIQSDYLNSCFKDFGMEKMKISKPAVPDLRAALDGDPGNPLSNESYSRFRRVLGKLAWFAQTREDLHIFMS